MFEKLISDPRTGVKAFYHVTSDVHNKDLLYDTFTITISCYTNQAAYLTNQEPLFKIKEYVPYANFGQNMVKTIEQYILANVNSIFFGGNLKSAMATDPLEYSRDKQRAIIQSSRDVAMASINGDLISQEIAAAVDNIKTTYQELKNQLISAQTISEIEAIVWPT